jgi:hypothetical protein
MIILNFTEYTLHITGDNDTATNRIEIEIYINERTNATANGKHISFEFF